MTTDVQAAVEHLRTLLDDIDAHSRNAGIDPAAHLSARVFPGFPYDLTIGDLHAVLDAVDQLDAAVERTTAKMREYDTGAVNVRQVINLLSLTWPDGNYAAAAPRDGQQ